MVCRACTIYNNNTYVQQYNMLCVRLVMNPLQLSRFSKVDRRDLYIIYFIPPRLISTYMAIIYNNTYRGQFEISSVRPGKDPQIMFLQVRSSIYR